MSEQKKSLFGLYSNECSNTETPATPLWLNYAFFTVTDWLLQGQLEF